MSTHTLRNDLGPAAIAAGGGLIAIMLLAGCSTSDGNRVRATDAEGFPRHDLSGDRPITIDGDFADWDQDLTALADEDYLYLRFIMEGDAYALQSSDETLVLKLDLDDDPDTGATYDTPRVATGLGVDLEIHFSPRRDELDAEGRGVELRAHTDNGVRDLTHAEADFHFSPTHASNNYEARLSRHIDGVDIPALGPNDNRGTGRARGVFVLYDGDQEVIGWSDPFRFDLPPAGDQRRLADATAPRHDGESLRIVSYNLDHGALMNNPEPFARVLNYLDPDIVLAQEWWDGTGESQMAEWFSFYVDEDEEWEVVARPEQGVAIISRYPVLVRDDADLLPAEGSIDENRPVRYVAAIVQTPFHDALVSSIHLKCCGNAGGPEDMRRIAEAEAVNSALRELAEDWAPIRVLGGDVNLVGSTQPLSELGRGLDADGAALTPAFASVLGDAAMYTWFDESSRFSAGRLDYALFGASHTELIHAFVLDTTRLSDSSLERMGLEREDTRASDHLPLVIDLRVYDR